jgi:uncharacterized protein YciI
MALLIGLWFLLHLAIQAGPPPASTELYYVVFLRPAPDRTRLTQAEGDRIQAAHMANILAMAARGVMVAAGPFDAKPPAISGIFVFARGAKVGSLDEARRIAAEDPTVVEHRNIVDVVPWLGPPGIGAEYARLHAERPDMPQDMGIQPFFLIYRAASTAGPDAALREHAAYLDQLHSTGVIGAAGPTEGRDDLLSIVVFNRIDEAVAARLMADDPAVKSGALRAEAHGWYCADHVLPGKR